MIELRDRCKINSAHILSSEDKEGEGKGWGGNMKNQVFSPKIVFNVQKMSTIFLTPDKIES